jgi:hypothetical protein
VDQPAGWDVAFEAVEKAQKFLVPVALHALPDDGAVKHVEGGKQGDRAFSYLERRPSHILVWAIIIFQ